MRDGQDSLSQVLYSGVKEFFVGFLDSLRIDRIIGFVMDNKEKAATLVPLLLKSILLNLVLIALVDYIMNTTVIPLFKQSIFYPIYLVTWIGSIFFIQIVIINNIQFSALATLVRPPRQGGGELTLLEFLEEKLNTFGIKIVLNIQMTVFMLIPYVGWYVTFIYSAWYWAYCCFECHWIKDKISLEHRLGYFEMRWSYYLGFGLVIQIMYEYFSTTFSFFVGAGVTATYFSLLIILSAEAPKRNEFGYRFSFSAQASTATDLAFEKFGAIKDILMFAISFIERKKVEAKENWVSVVVFSFLFCLMSCLAYSKYSQEITYFSRIFMDHVIIFYPAYRSAVCLAMFSPWLYIK